MLESKVKTTILKHNLLEKGDHIVIGLSGGPDSVCLFSVLYGLAREMELSLHAVHINHKLRPQAAEADQAYVEDLCRRRSVPCNVYVYDCNKIAAELGVTSEEAGRKVRYEAFADTAEKIAAEELKDVLFAQEKDKIKTAAPNRKDKIKIAVAHNMNDQAETVLFRLLRGTGIDGLAGMEYKRRDENGFTIIRPLLDTARDEIEEYCNKNELDPRIDHTNEQAIYTRNKIRLELLPYLKENFNTNIIEALCRLAKIAGEDKSYIWSRAQEAYEEALIKEADGKCDSQVCGLYLKKVQEAEPAIRHRVISAAFAKLGLLQDITASHLEAADRLIESGRTGSSIDFPHGYRMRIGYGEVFAEKADQKTEKDGSFAAVSACEADTGPDENGCVWRTRMPGDYIKVKLTKEQDGVPAKYGTKKLQDYFVDKKVPRELRDSIMLLCRGHEVLKIEYEFRRKS